MIIKQKFFGLYCCLLLVHSCVHAIYDPNDGNTKKGFQRNAETGEPIVMHHKYSQVASNRPLSRASTEPTFDSVRQSRTSYTNEAENYIAQYGLECPPNATGQFPYLLNCRQFLNCWKGRGHIQSCAPGTVFNPDTRECDNPEKVICLNYRGETNAKNQFARLEQDASENHEDPPPTAYRESSVKKTESQNVKCPPEAVGLQPHPFDCAKYLNCANGISYIQDCGPGTVFNAIASVCDWPYNVDCSSRNGRKLNASETVSINQNNENYTRANPRVYQTIHRHRNNDASVSPHGTDRVRESGTLPGYEDHSQHTDSSYPNYPEAPTSSNQFSRIPQGDLSQSNNNGNNGEPFFSHHQHSHQPGSFPHRHMTPPPAGWQQWTGSAGITHGNQQGSRQGNRESKSGWNASAGTNSPVWQKPITDSHTSTQSFSIDQAQVQEMQSSGFIPSNKTTVHYAQPAHTFDFSNNHGQQNVPSPFLQPPKVPIEEKVITESADRSKMTIYYAQPIGTYGSRDFQTFSNGTIGWKEIKEPPTARANKTVVYYATPVRDYHNLNGYDNRWDDARQNKNNRDIITEQSQDPSYTSNIPDQEQTSSWANTKIPSSPKSIVYPTNSKPLYDANRKLLPSQELRPTSESSQTTPYNQLIPPYPEAVPPTIPIVPVPYGDLLPPMLDTVTTKKPTEVAQPPVLYPPLEPTKPITGAESKQEKVFHVYSAPSSNTHEGVNTRYSGVTHSIVSSDLEKDSHLRQRGEEDVITKKIVPIYSRPNSLHSKTMLDKSSTHLPPPYNHVYYNPPEAHTSDSENIEHSIEGVSSAEPTAHILSEALKTLLRPYLNRSGNVTEDAADRMGQHIMKLSKANSAQNPSITPLKKEPTDFEVEFNFSGEQDNLNRETQHHQQETSLENSDENPSQVSMHRADSDHAHLHHHRLHHDHRNHGPACNHTHHNHRHPSNHHHAPNHHHPPNHRHHPNHRHYWNHNNGSSSHNRDFHNRHPNIPNPFATNDLENSDTPDQQLDTIEPRLDTNPWTNRHNLTEGKLYPELDAAKPTCQFDCQNGKCVREYQVCDGVNNCGNRLDEADCDAIGYQVRLSSDEGKSNMGRVEVKVRGQWGYVCDDKFGMRAADVLCKELGFVLGASEVRGNSFYPPHREMYDKGVVRYLMDEVDCLGNETSIRECEFMGWGVHDCSPDEVVGVVCKIPVMTCPPNYWLCKTSQECVAIGFLCDSVPDCQDSSDEHEEMCNEAIQYRIVGGPSEMEGRVEVKYRDTWGTICDDDFGKIEAQVICRTLGYLGEASIIKNAYGGGTGPIWLDQVSCVGNETTFEQCSHWAWGEHNCDHKEDVSVKCSERLAHPRAEPTTSTTLKPEQEQWPEEDIDLYLYKVQRSSKAFNTNKRCGQINEHAVDEFNTDDEFARVVNGTKAIRGRHPWQASLRAKGRNGMSTHWCGAILITQMHVLTAAHCLVGYQKEALFVRMGDHYSKIAEPSEIDSFIQNWYVHEEFRKGHHMNNDIGLIVLKSPVIFNDYIQPICLPPKDAKYEEGMRCTISGWGSIKSGISTPSNNLKAAHVPIIPQTVCKQPYVYGKAITDGMFCAGYLDEGVDACDGDSGGPLACSSPNGETLYGIISWGQHCGQANKPGVYVKVSYYMDWIMDKIMYSMKGNHE